MRISLVVRRTRHGGAPEKQLRSFILSIEVVNDQCLYLLEVPTGLWVVGALRLTEKSMLAAQYQRGFFRLFKAIRVCCAQHQSVAVVTPLVPIAARVCRMARRKHYWVFAPVPPRTQ